MLPHQISGGRLPGKTTTERCLQRLYLLLLLSVFAPVPVLASTGAAFLETAIQARVTDTILQQYSGATRENLSFDLDLPAVVSTLDSCKQAVKVEAGRDRWLGRIRLSISCQNPSWRFNTSAETGLVLPVAALRSSLPRNHILAASDLVFRPQNIANLRQGYFVTAKPLVGTALVRDLSRGHVLSSRSIEVPPLVQRGDRVTIRATGQGFSATMAGEALNQGVRGRQIRVRNLSSGRVISAWVVARGLVEIATTDGLSGLSSGQ